MAGVAAIAVGSERELDTAIAMYIAQGFVVANRSSNGATMFKKKEFQIVWAVIGFILCVFPLLIYLIVYASQSDQMVEIQLRPSDQQALPASPGQLVGTRSADGRWWWDGQAWQPVPDTLPTPSAQPTFQQPAASSEWLPAPEAGAEHPTDPGDVTPPH